MSTYSNISPGGIIATDNDKGGVGKSFTGLCLAHCLTIAGFAWVGIDGDRRNAHLHRFHGPGPKVRRLPLDTVEHWDQMIDTIERDVPLDTVVLIDCPAGAGHMMEVCGPRLKAFAAHQGRPFMRLCAMDEEDDVLLALNRTRSLGFDHVVACLNGRFAPSPEAFELWRKPMPTAPSLREQVLNAGGIELYIPPLRASVRSQLRRANLPFHRGNEANLSWSETQSLANWLYQVETAFAPVIARLTGGAQ